MFAVSTGDNLFQLIVVLVIFIVILFATYYVTKWIAGYQKTQIWNKNFKVIETIKITGNKYLQIVQVGKEDYYVIGIGKEEITMLGKLNAEQLIEIDDAPKQAKRISFSEILASFREQNEKD